jgi:hypothetical protein
MYVFTRFWWENMRKKSHLKNPRVFGTVILRLIFRKLNAEAWTGLCCLRICTGGGYL